MDFCLNEGKPVVVTVSKYTKTRSNDQNRYMWGVVYRYISESTGMTPEESHDAMRMLFLRVSGDGRSPDTIKSTTELSTVQFEEYIESVKQFAAEKLGTYIPDPNEVDY
jgi:hypothetical protein